MEKVKPNLLAYIILGVIAEVFIILGAVHIGIYIAIGELKVALWIVVALLVCGVFLRFVSEAYKP